VPGHQLARLIIQKHATDRYPTIEKQLIKVVEELGELARAILRDDREAMGKEYADTGLALYELGNKLYLDLDDCMHEVVRNETRNFAEGSTAGEGSDLRP
jgi:NTP pyrophosphatase (non-canonical NTP hydrolase)